MSTSVSKKRKIEEEEDFLDSSLDEGEDFDFDQHKKPANKYSKGRKSIRNASSFSNFVRISQQICKVVNKKEVLLAWKNSTRDQRLQNRIDRLLAVLETLLLPSTYKLQAYIKATEEGFPNIKHGGLLRFQEVSSFTSIIHMQGSLTTRLEKIL